MIRVLPFVLSLSVLWLLLSGFFEPLILFLGVVSIALVAWLSRRMDIVDTESYPFRLIPKLSTYWLWLLKEIVKSSWDTSKRALFPSATVRPVVVDVPATQRSDLGLVIHANSITLTPGTVTLDVMPGSMRVHALHRDVADDVLQGDMNARIPDAKSAS